jgi:hypothetical protein
MKVGTTQIPAWQLSFAKKPEIVEPEKAAIKPLQKTDTPRQRDPNAEFYSRVESPWLAKTATGEIHPVHRRLSEEQITVLRDEYLEKLQKKAAEPLRKMFDSYYNLKSQLSYTNPELTKKYFGFTLGFDQQVKITDPNGVLTPVEAAFLTEQLNNREGFRDTLVDHARLLMQQVDHDRKRFPDRCKINLENYSKIIDYGQLFSRNTIGSFIKVLSYQLERNAEKVDEKKPESLIDVRA